jgi:site-specific DNA recombinase
MRKVRKIEVPKKDTVRKLRVAAYCRVSTKYESQKSSIELQKDYYEGYIKAHPNWLFAGVYADYGSRVRIDKRTEFQKMIQKVVNGEMDCIITKSISRFSGNTVDMLQTIRLLKEKGVTVWFEKENIRSADENIELVITIHTMLAQEEIRNMSENIQWGFKRRFEQGITLNNYKYFYGYDVINGELVINEQQAAVVRDIYEWYLQGMSLGQIKKRLEEKKIKTASGKDVWSKSVIQEMLCNEKYMGDCMLQKYFTEDYLSGKKAKNIGQRDKYYVHDSHEGIISKEKFLEVACEMNRRKNLAVKNDDEIVKKGRKYNPQNVLGNILECEECGAAFRRRTERGKVVYRCATRMEKGREACKESPTVGEEWIKEELGKRVCGGEYDEEVVRKKVDKGLVAKDGEVKIVFRD